MKFKSNTGIFVCPHVYENSRPVRLVVHDEGDWQCLCGEDDHEDEGHLVGIGHLIERDPTIDVLFDLPNGWEAERADVNEPWLRTRTEPNQ